MNIEEARKIMRSCKAFEERLKSLKQVEDNQHIQYPTTIRLFGYPEIKIESKKELSGRINELLEWLGYELVKEER